MINRTGIWQKLARKVNGIIVNKIEGTPLQFSWYRSWWHYKLSAKKNPAAQTGRINNTRYISQKPNHGAGIGHQLANWNAAYYFSDFYDLQFAHLPFSNEKWEHFLGFGENEKDANALLKSSYFKKVKLPRFDNTNEGQVALIGDIIGSYNNNNTLFLLELDQGYIRQCDTYKALSDKFFKAPARKENNFFYKTGDFNIAIHIRRGDIADLAQANNKQRWLDNNYYVNVLTQVLQTMPADKKVQVYLFSQGTREDFAEFSAFPGIQYCLDVNAYDSFLHMAYANILISSKSSFSYKPALISKGIKICPADFWHSYPSAPDFILADNDGNFKQEKLQSAMAPGSSPFLYKI